MTFRLGVYFLEICVQSREKNRGEHKMDTEPLAPERTIKDGGNARMLAFYYASQSHPSQSRRILIVFVVKSYCLTKGK